MRAFAMLAKLFRSRRTPASLDSAVPDGVASKPPSPGRRGWALHPFLIAIFPILSVYSHNVYELPIVTLVEPIGIALAATSVVLLAFWIGMRDAVRAGLATSLVVILFFSFESIRTVANSAWFFVNSFWVVRETSVYPLVVLALEIVVAIAGIRLICRRLDQPNRWTSYLNAFTLILVALPTSGLIYSRVGTAWMTHRDAAMHSLGRENSTPDIYFIVLDGYARSDIMKEYYGYDNKPFLDRLERQGFVVAKQSTSNYCQTMLSLASTLNFDYLDSLVEIGSNDLLPLMDRIKKNRVSSLLRERGYKTVAFATGFDATDMKDADVYMAPGPETSAFQDILISMTPLALIFAEVRWADRFSERRERTLYLLDRLPSIAKDPAPTFTFAHLVSPHPPFIFGPNGEDTSPRMFAPGYHSKKLDASIGTPAYVRRAYRDQSSFLTGRIQRTIDRILEQSPEPPIIILQSDHGAWLHYHVNDAEATDLRERYATLNAILMPGRKLEGFTDDAISVNTFRIVLNNAFGTKLPLLPRRTSFSTVYNPLKIIDVTERLLSEKERTRKFKPPDVYLGITQQF